MDRPGNVERGAGLVEVAEQRDVLVFGEVLAQVVPVECGQFQADRRARVVVH